MELNYIKGIGESTINKLNKLDIYSIEDLINYYPYRYEILKKTNLKNEFPIVSGVIESNPTVSYFRNKKNMIRFRLNVSNQIINVIIYNRVFIKNNLSIGKEITIIGKYDKFKNEFIASNLILEDIGSNERIIPVYHKIRGLTDRGINKYVNLGIKSSFIPNLIPDYIKNKYNYIDKKDAVNIINNPTNLTSLNNALEGLKYEELFLFMLKINELKNKNSINNIGYSKDINIDKVKEFIKKLPFELTIDQKNALTDIFNDLKSIKRMNRLVEGDVGSGKTIVAVISMFQMYLDNYQSVLMAPTEILSHQHYENIINLFKDYDINVKEISGSTSKKEKELIKEELKNGNIDIIIGTHALIEDDIEFKNLGLVITDEQHRFGVNQRSNLRNKGNMPDVLYLSATPIPRTYALTIYGDMDISIIKSKPSGRKEVVTLVRKNNEIKDVLIRIKKELDLGHQVYVVSPLIENEDSDEEDIVKLERKFKLAFKNKNIGIMHGKMTSKEKDDIMKKYQNKKIDILISTTVIEVGVDVKNATMIVIFDAYKFGLATLHQLRGRVGRNDLDSYCILVSNKETKRLDIMKEISDGFKLAEEDFKLRGSGDLFGTKQSGDMNFKLVNLNRDFDLLKKANIDSIKVLEEIDNYPLLKGILEKSINKD